MLRELPCRITSQASVCAEGLPEEMRIVRIVTKADYAAVAFSSIDTQSHCWDAQWLDKSVDMPAVRTCKITVYSAAVFISCVCRSCRCDCHAQHLASKWVSTFWSLTRLSAF